MSLSTGGHGGSVVSLDLKTPTGGSIVSLGPSWVDRQRFISLWTVQVRSVFPLCLCFFTNLIEPETVRKLQRVLQKFWYEFVVGDEDRKDKRSFCLGYKNPLGPRNIRNISTHPVHWNSPEVQVSAQLLPTQLKYEFRDDTDGVSSVWYYNGRGD